MRFSGECGRVSGEVDGVAGDGGTGFAKVKKPKTEHSGEKEENKMRLVWHLNEIRTVTVQGILAMLLIGRIFAIWHKEHVHEPVRISSLSPAGAA